MSVVCSEASRICTRLSRGYTKEIDWRQILKADMRLMLGFYCLFCCSAPRCSSAKKETKTWVAQKHFSCPAVFVLLWMVVVCFVGLCCSCCCGSCCCRSQINIYQILICLGFFFFCTRSDMYSSQSLCYLMCQTNANIWTEHEGDIAKLNFAVQCIWTIHICDSCKFDGNETKW